MNINVTNWNHYFYQQDHRKSYISLLYQEDLENPLYQVVVLEDEHREVFLQAFSKLADACHYLNARYFHWDLISSKIETKEGSCGTCSAH